jgi:aldose 1-epimerase
MKFSSLFLMLAATLAAGNYTARRTTVEGVPVISLADAAQGVEVTVLPSIGNRVSAMKVHGENILFFPSGNLAELQKKPDVSGIPFLAPWANRLNAESFWANGKNYPFNMTLGNVRGPIPIHGLLMHSDLW